VNLAEGVGFEPTVQTLLSDATPSGNQLRSIPRTLKSRIAKERRSKSRYLSQYVRQVPDVPETGFHPTRLSDVLAHGLDYLGPQMNNARSRPPYYLDSSDPHVKAANDQNIWKLCT